MNNILRPELWHAFLETFFPAVCLGCGLSPKDRKISFCPACLEKVRFIQEPMCRICGTPFENAVGRNHLCGHCLNKKWNFNRAFAVTYYQGPVVEAVRLFKYSGRMHGLPTLAAMMREAFPEGVPCLPDLVLPVPLHPRKLRERGFNQALVLCRKLFPESRKMIAPLVLERPRWTKSQAGLDGSARRRNVRNAFRVRSPELVKNRKILLVDDVFTTGATVNECSKILRKSGAAEINIFTFARVVIRQ